MKSIFVTALMFGFVLLAIRYGVFAVTSSIGFYLFAFVLFFGALFFAYRVLGNPFDKKKDDNDDKKQN